MKGKINLKDKFQPLIEKSLHEMKKSKIDKTSVAFYNTVWDSGENLHNNNEACHAGLRDLTVYNSYWPGYRPKNLKSKPVAVLNSIQNLKCSKDTARLFLEWLYNHSPYSVAFISKDPEQALKDGVSIVDTDVPTNRMIGGLVAQRAITEYKYLIDTWEALVKNGLHPNLAFAFIHYFRGIKEKNTLSVYPDDCHTALNGSKIVAQKEHYVLNFINSIAKDEPNYIKQQAYNGIGGCWSGANPLAEKYRVINEIAGFINDLLGTKKSSNPFAVASDTKSKSIPFDKGIKAVAEFLSNGYKGAINVG